MHWKCGCAGSRERIARLLFGARIWVTVEAQCHGYAVLRERPKQQLESCRLRAGH